MGAILPNYSIFLVSDIPVIFAHILTNIEECKVDQIVGWYVFVFCISWFSGKVPTNERGSLPDI